MTLQVEGLGGSSACISSHHGSCVFSSTPAWAAPLVALKEEAGTSPVAGKGPSLGGKGKTPDLSNVNACLHLTEGSRGLGVDERHLARGLRA